MSKSSEFLVGALGMKAKKPGRVDRDDGGRERGLEELENLFGIAALRVGSVRRVCRSGISIWLP